MNKLHIGTRVEHLMGINNGKQARVISSSQIKTDGRGVPDIGQGDYHPFDPKKHIAVMRDDGQLDVWQIAMCKVIVATKPFGVHA